MIGGYVLDIIRLKKLHKGVLCERYNSGSLYHYREGAGLGSVQGRLQGIDTAF